MFLKQISRANVLPGARPIRPTKQNWGNPKAFIWPLWVGNFTLSWKIVLEMFSESCWLDSMLSRLIILLSKQAKNAQRWDNQRPDKDTMQRAPFLSDACRRQASLCNKSIMFVLLIGKDVVPPRRTLWTVKKVCILKSSDNKSTFPKSDKKTGFVDIRTKRHLTKSDKKSSNLILTFGVLTNKVFWERV